MEEDHSATIFNGNGFSEALKQGHSGDLLRLTQLGGFHDKHLHRQERKSGIHHHHGSARHVIAFHN